LYRARKFAQAAEALEEILRAKQDDGPARWLLKQCTELQQHAPENWEPVTTATSK
jgi:hypothetical protein